MPTLELPTESGDKVKFCKDCRFVTVVKGSHEDTDFLCSRLLEERTNHSAEPYLVTGIDPSYSVKMRCRDARVDLPELCGPMGQFWEAKR